jgi:PKD repeat protein
MPRFILAIFAVFFGMETYAQVTAKFSADTTSGCTPVTVNFQDKSGGTVTSYYWTFGNGNTSTKKNPSAIFYKPGTYTVTLKVTDGSGKESSESKTAYVEVFELPKAGFKPSKTNGCAPLTVPFSNTSTKGSGALTNALWDFGDGNTLSSLTGYHTYNYAGTYSLSLLVTDANGCEDKIKQDDIITVWPVPEVDFEADETFGCLPPMKVKFKNLTTKGGTGFKYEWSFGDGSTSTQENPTHTYDKKGNFTVSLKVTNSKGCSYTKQISSYVTINPIKVDFDINKIGGCAPLDVTFTNKTSPDISGFSYNWDLGNGDKLQTKHAATTYTKPGSYTVSLTVSKNGKCNQTTTYSNAINVKPAPDPKLVVDDSVSCYVPFEVNVEDQGTASNSWTWLLDGKPVTKGQTSTVTISTYAAHVISLVTANNYGCVSDTLNKLIQVQPIEVTATVDTQGCVPLTVQFRNTSNLGKYGMATQAWDFGDGTSQEITDSSVRTASHTYQERGVYTVILKVTIKKDVKDKLF